jgi:glyoxylase-like metal-dependent hydrolase (beta-lactamase superfamily II)
MAVRLFALPILAGGLWLALFAQQQAQPLNVVKVKEDLYSIEGSGGNVGVYVTSEGVILIDDKFERNYDEILAKVKTVTDKPVKYVLNTHQHGDHTGGNAKMLAAAVEVLAHRNAATNMTKGNMPGVPRISFSDEATVTLGGKSVRARHFGRGHTNGDAVMYFPELRVVHMGDLFVTASPFIDYSAGGSAVEWTRTIDEVLKLDIEAVIPGHGPISKKQDLMEFRGKMETLRNRMSELKRQGKSSEEAAKMIQLEDLGWKLAGLFEKSMVGLYDEVGRR